jgi:hypothetical protein
MNPSSSSPILRLWVRQRSLYGLKSFLAAQASVALLDVAVTYLGPTGQEAAEFKNARFRRWVERIINQLGN